MNICILYKSTVVLTPLLKTFKSNHGPVKSRHFNYLLAGFPVWRRVLKQNFNITLRGKDLSSLLIGNEVFAERDKNMYFEIDAYSYYTTLIHFIAWESRFFPLSWHLYFIVFIRELTNYKIPRGPNIDNV